MVLVGPETAGKDALVSKLLTKEPDRLVAELSYSVVFVSKIKSSSVSESVTKCYSVKVCVQRILTVHNLQCTVHGCFKTLHAAHTIISYSI